jgi:protein phosphatase PTC7
LLNVSAVASIPHPEKVFKGGEDASFVSEDGHAIGVFDGVGGWAGTGVDPAVYSRSLASECAAAHKQTGSRSPKELLERAWLNSQRITGSSTACCVTLHGSTLRGANVGDSGFMVVRQGALFYRQKEQQHSFNFPFQLGTGSTDSPNDADCVELELQPGDVVVASTDGVGDNLFPEEIVSIVREGLTLGKSETEMATRIAQVASSRANSTVGRSPFSVNAQQSGYEYSGGKLDDITVVVAIVEASAKL